MTLKDSFGNLFGEKKEIMIFIADIIINIAIIVGLVYVIRTFLISPFQVSGPSMCNTLNYINEKCENSFGEYIIVNKATYGNFFGWVPAAPKRGDIIVFHPPQNKQEFFIKRIIGLPGETVKIEHGDVFVFNKEHPEGFQLNEPYLNSINQHNTLPNPTPLKKDNSIFEVPDNNFFVLGDNRTQSTDSRSCFKESISSHDCGSPGITSFLPREYIEGRAWLVLWPFSNIKALQDQSY